MLSMATDMPVNIFQEDRACSMLQQGLDLQCPSIVLTTYHSSIWCKEGTDEAVVDPPPVVQPEAMAPRKVCGRPCVKDQAYQHEDSSTEMDPNDLLEVLSRCAYLYCCLESHGPNNAQCVTHV